MPTKASLPSKRQGADPKNNLPDPHPPPSIAVDIVALSAYQADLWALLISRSAPPFAGSLALPGGFIDHGESLDQAAARIMARETSLRRVYLEQLYSFGDPSRDPRRRVISVAYYALVNWQRLAHLKSSPQASLFRLNIPWEGEKGGAVKVHDHDGKSLQLAFDHAEILGVAVKRIRGKLDYVPIGFQLLPKKFSLRQLQEVHETVLNRKLNKDSFRRRMLASGLIEATGDREEQVVHRPAELYRFTYRSAI